VRRSNIDAWAGAIEEIARIVAQIRESWPGIEILLRQTPTSPGRLMARCEAGACQHRAEGGQAGAAQPKTRGLARGGYTPEKLPKSGLKALPGVP
jgi:hypothetical protein